MYETRHAECYSVFVSHFLLPFIFDFRYFHMLVTLYQSQTLHGGEGETLQLSVTGQRSGRNGRNHSRERTKQNSGAPSIPNFHNLKHGWNSKLLMRCF